jgi:Arc/MetJ family transcription regulator
MQAMRISIEIDDDLMCQAMKACGGATKKEAVEAGLRLLIKTHSQIAIRKLRGKVKWEGNLDRSRLGHVKE